MSAALVALALLAAACSDDTGGGSSNAEDRAAEALANDPRTDEQRAADLAAARAALLTIADFPAGWAAEPPDEGDEGGDDADAALEADMAACLGVDVSFFGESVVSADSETFTLEDADVELTVSVEPDVASATTQMDTMRGPEAATCFQQAFRDLIQTNIDDPPPGEELPEGVEIGEATVGQLAVDPVGEDVLGFRFTMPMSAQGLSVDVYLDIVVVRVGRTGASFLFSSIFTPPDPAFVQQLLGVVAARMPVA